MDRTSAGGSAAAAGSRQAADVGGDLKREPPSVQTPQWPEWAQVPDQPASTESAWPSFVVPLLLAIVVVQAGALGWLLFDRRGASGTPLLTASVAITSEPAGAVVVVDGVERGNTPFTLEDLRPGVSPILVRQVPASPGAAPLEGGALEITTEPAGLAVSVDGRQRGVSPVAVTGLIPGPHEVAVTRGTAVVRRTVSVEAGVPTAVLISTAGQSGISSGWLTVTTPVPVQILENGTLLGSSEAPRLLLPVGRHELDFVSEAFQYRTRQVVQVTAGQSAAVALESVNGTLSVNAQPWAEVWIDGKSIGETPIGNLSLPIGNHELVLRHPQLGERRRTVAVGAGAPTRVGVDLRQK